MSNPQLIQKKRARGGRSFDGNFNQTNVGRRKSTRGLREEDTNDTGNEPRR